MALSASLIVLFAGIRTSSLPVSVGWYAIGFGVLFSALAYAYARAQAKVAQDVRRQISQLISSVTLKRSRTPERVSIVVPFFNIASEVDTLVRRTADIANEVRSKHRVELIFVDDGSSDDTYARLKINMKALEDAEFTVSILQIPSRLGFEKAVQAAADQANGDIIVPVDPQMLRASEPPGVMQWLRGPHVGLEASEPIRRPS
jgi:cellulose synthase/poly-beta-1,6-N-acetylglucosamine synthase-like glycosyltransferase